MIADFEKRLADVLGSRLAPPLAGRVFVAPGPDDTTKPAVLVGVRQAELVGENFGAARRPESVPGADDPRRVVRLRCTVRVEVRAAADATRTQIVQALDALAYELDAPDLRSADALREPGDRGFLLTGQLPETVLIAPDVEGALPAVELAAEGWFWPPNAPGITGRPIAAALVRTASLPIALEPWPLALRVGDPDVVLTITVGGTGTARFDGESATVSAFGELALRVLDSGGRPGAGALLGGAAGPDGAMLLDVVGDKASFRYRIPAAPANDELVVNVGRADTGSGPGVGIELARFPLEVRA